MVVPPTGGASEDISTQEEDTCNTGLFAVSKFSAGAVSGTSATDGRPLDEDRLRCMAKSQVSRLDAHGIHRLRISKGEVFVPTCLELGSILPRAVSLACDASEHILFE